MNEKAPEETVIKEIIIIIIIIIIASQEKTSKYAPLWWEMSPKFPAYRVTQHNTTLDVLVDYPKGMAKSVPETLGMQRAEDALLRMQKTVISSTLHIAISFKTFVKKCR